MKPGHGHTRTVGVIAGLALALASPIIARAHPTPTTPASSPSASTTAPALPNVFALPDPQLHPGGINSTLAQNDICAPGFTTARFRPPQSYTSRLKDLELGGGGTIRAPSGKTYTVAGEHLPGTTADYELDHLISLELAGDPEDPANLWMQPWERKGHSLAATGRGAESKDVLENRLHREVCTGSLTLTDAQHEIATNWTTAT